MGEESDSILSDNVKFYLYVVLAGLAAVPGIILCFVSDVPASSTYSANPLPFFNLWIAISLLCFSQICTTFIPDKMRALFRLMFFYLFIANVDAAVCLTHTYIEWDKNTGPPWVEQRNGVRAGAVMMLMFGVLTFIVACFLNKKPKMPSGMGNMIRLALFAVGMFFLFLAQCIQWGQKKMCTDRTVQQSYSPIQPISLVLLTFMYLSAMLGDNDVFDVLFIWAVNTLLSQCPAFVNIPDASIKALGLQSNINSLMKSIHVFVWLAALFYVVGCVCGAANRGSWGSKAEERAVAIYGRFMSKRMLIQGVLFIAGLVGAIMVYIRSPQNGTATRADKFYCFGATFGIMVPLLNMAGVLAAFDVFPFVTAAFSFGCTMMLAAATPHGTGYFRAGCMMVLSVQLISPMVTYLTQMPKVRPINEYFTGPDRLFFIAATVLIYVVPYRWNANKSDWYFALFSAAYIVVGGLVADPDARRLTFMFGLMYICTSWWPLGVYSVGSTTAAIPTDGATFPLFVTFVIFGLLQMFSETSADCFVILRKEHLLNNTSMVMQSQNLIDEGKGATDGDYQAIEVVGAEEAPAKPGPDEKYGAEKEAAPLPPSGPQPDPPYAA